MVAGTSPRRTTTRSHAKGISLGIVGLGSFGSDFVDLFRSHPLVSRVALCDREPDRVAHWAERESLQAKLDRGACTDSLDALCAANLDAIAIFTQPWLHAPQAVQALEAGKHVYSAVPILTVPDGDEILDWCDRLVATCRRTGQLYMLGETTYYRPETMYCRRQAAAGAFGRFVYAEGEYFHDVDDPGCSLREVGRLRLSSAAGQEWVERERTYAARGIEGGPMHYPTHSTCGPVSVMRAHMTKVSAWGQRNTTDEFYAGRLSNETALFLMSNGATTRIAQYSEIGHAGQETFRVFGSEGSYRDGQWVNKHGPTPLALEELRDPLPPEVAEAWARELGADFLGGHGGSHAYLVHEFVDAVAHVRRPAIHVWEAVRYTAPGVVAHQSALRDGERLDVPDWGDAAED